MKLSKIKTRDFSSSLFKEFLIMFVLALSVIPIDWIRKLIYRKIYGNYNFNNCCLITYFSQSIYVHKNQLD